MFLSVKERTVDLLAPKASIFLNAPLFPMSTFIVVNK